MNREGALVCCAAVARTYGIGETAIVGLRPTDCSVESGAKIALVGASGSGKSTLLHLMAGLDSPSSGTVSWPAIGPPERLRPGPIAVVFQGPSLLPALTVLENVGLPLALGGRSDRDAKRIAADALERLDLGDLAAKLPEEISGGQAQRVAVARALAGEPALILADEPTGQLDHLNGARVIDVLLAAADHSSAGLVISTHDPSVAERLQSRWEINGGELRNHASRAPAVPFEARR